MAEEIRRSGRATKGQYTKERDIPEETPTKKKGKGSRSKRVEEEPEEENEIIRCVCGQYEEEEDNPRAMICCDSCSAWQHNDCMGLPEDYAPEKYFCEECKPEDHKELLEAMARGERPWEEVARQREAALAEQSGLKKKKGRKGVARISEAPSRASEDVDDTPVKGGQKRKLEESPGAGDLKDIKKVRGTPGSENDGHGRKAGVMGTPSRQASRSEIAPANDVKELKNPTRKGVANTLITLFIDQTNTAVEQGLYTVPEGSKAKDIGTELGLGIEHALYHTLTEGFGEPGDAYKAQTRAIVFNVKKNPALRDRLLSGDLTPQKLAMMNPKEMASEEQQRRDAEMQKELERQHTLPQEQGPRIRQTHKGLEYVDEANQVAAESSTSNVPPRRQSTVDQDHVSASPDTAKSPTHPSSRKEPSITINTQRSRPSTDPQRRSSTNFDIKNVWDSVQGSPDTDRQQFPEIRSPIAIEQPRHSARPDAEIDALLKDEEPEPEQAESPPYSPKDADDEVVWRGPVNGQALGRFHGEARYAAGCTPADLHMNWRQLIPTEIAVGGRIDPQKADEYLCGLQYSSTSDLVVVSIREPENTNDQVQFNKLFDYFKTRNRYGVGVQHDIPAVKDIYLIPLEVGQEAPTLLKLLADDKKKIDDRITERMLLLPFVVKNTELPHQQANPDHVPVQQTPITPLGSSDGHFQESAPFAQNQYGPLQSQPHTNGHAAPLPLANQQPYPPYQPTYNQTQHQSPPPSYTPYQPQQTTASIAALQVLGPQLASAPAVQQLIAQAPNAGTVEMGVVKEIIEQNAEAARDLAVLTAMLEGRTR